MLICAIHEITRHLSYSKQSVNPAVSTAGFLLKILSLKQLLCLRVACKTSSEKIPFIIRCSGIRNIECTLIASECVLIKRVERKWKICQKLNYHMPEERNYLFYAGTRTGSLPVAKEMKTAVKSMIEKISCSSNELPETDRIPDSDRSWESFRQEVIEDLQWLYEKSESHAGGETVAKVPYMQQPIEEITKLRNVRSMFQTMAWLEEPYSEQ